MAQVEQVLRKIIEFHDFNSNEGFSCLIPDKDPYPSNEGLLLWFSSKTRIETKVQLFHSPARIRRMEDMLNLPEKEYSEVFAGHVEDFLNSLREIGFENIGKGVDLFGMGKVSNVKANFEMFENNPDMLRKFEQITLNNPIVKFAEDQGYFKCANKDTLAYDEFFGAESMDSAPKSSRKESAAKRTAAKGKKKEAVSSAKAKKPAKATKVAEKAKSSPPAAAATATKAKTKAKAKKGKATADESSSIKDKLRSTAQKKKAAPPEGSERQKLWAKQVENLYKKIQNWVGSYIKNGQLAVNFHQVELADETGKLYKMDCLELDAGYSQWIFQPMEMNVLGTVGRIDLYWPDGQLPKITLLLLSVVRNKPFWELWRGVEDRQSFDKDSFDSLLHDWLG